MQRKSAAAMAVCAAIVIGFFTALQAQNPDQVKQFRETGKCAGCDLREAMLDGVVAEFADLQGADLRAASLYKANLRAADLTGALLTGANLSGADLRNTKGADLVGATTDAMTQCPDGAAGPCK